MAATKRFSPFAVLLTLAAAFVPPPVLADGQRDLAKKSQKPVADVVSLPLLTAAGPVQAGEDQRQVPLDRHSNFRDLGGYETLGRRQVKWGEVFRSGRLRRLSDADVDRLESLGVRTVVNFLTRA